MSRPAETVAHDQRRLLCEPTGPRLFVKVLKQDNRMRAVVQRVSSASVVVEGETVGAIGPGFLILLGVAEQDREQDARWLASRISGLRVFEDEDGKMNRDLQAIGGAALVVSQFTLLGDCRRGRRPGFAAAARPEKARALYTFFVTELRQLGVPVETGTFQAQMQVQLVNDGPVTLLLDTQTLPNTPGGKS